MAPPHQAGRQHRPPWRAMGVATAAAAAVLVLAACEMHRSADAAGVDNSLCYHCHGGYRREPLSARHALAGVGCAECHGKSVRHLSDPKAVEPPDRMIAKEAVNPSCLECHPQAKLAAMAAHRGLFSAPAEGQQLCTDCHGEHRLDAPRRRWDKVTGELLWPKPSEVRNLAQEKRAVRHRLRAAGLRTRRGQMPEDSS